MNIGVRGLRVLELKTLEYYLRRGLLLALDWSVGVETEPVNSERSSITYVIKRERSDG